MTITPAPLLNPKSIAIVGASDRPSAGRSILVSLGRLGFTGAIYPINPKRNEILGHSCYASLGDVPGEVDAVAFCIGNKHLPDAYRAAMRKGVKAAAIYAGGFSESQDDAERQLGAQITAWSREAGIALCGPNCMGALSPSYRSTTYLHEVCDAKTVIGNVGLVSQSGAICIAMASDTRRFGFSHIISSGNEAVLTTCDFLEFLIADSSTRIIALFLESVREPDRFVALLDAAAAAGKPVIVLKVGKSERARHSIATHTGGLAGEAKVLSAVLRAHHAIEVETLGEMTEMLAACQGNTWPTGERIAVMTGSGGQAELILDVANVAGFKMPALTTAERAEVERVVGSITGDGNPLDAWGSGNPNTNYPHALRVLGSSSNFDAVAMVCDGMDDHPLDLPEEDLVYAEMVASAAAEIKKPYYLLSTRAGVFRTDQEKIARRAGVAVVSGVAEGLGAIRNLARWHRQTAPVMTSNAPARPAVPQGRSTINEFDAKRLLADAGVTVPREALVGTLEEALAARRSINGLVALKVCSDEIPHKSEFGLVELGIGDDDALAAAWHRIAARLKMVPAAPAISGMLVQEMIEGGVELFVGVNRDPDFGLILAFGLGGTLVEIIGEVTLRPLPLRRGDAEAMIAEVPLAERLLAGVRGDAPADRQALIATIEAIAAFAFVNRDRLDGLDVNPIKALSLAKGCVAVDAVIVPRQSR